MKEIPLEQVQEGDILARDLTSSNGAVFLAAGSILSAPALTRLKKMGIQNIAVKAKNPEDNAEAINKLLQLLEERFSGTENNPYLQEIKSIVIDHLKKPE